MGRFKEFGENKKSLHTPKNYWKQGIYAREKLLMQVKAGGLTAVTAWLYYRSLWAFPALLPFWIWNYKSMEKDCIYKKKAEFLIQFKEMIQSMASALNTGYSVENAVKETQKELRLLYAKDSLISLEMAVIVRQLRVQIPMEQALEEFAERVRLEDVKNFSAVFSAAKRSGGDMIAIIQNTVEQMSGRIEVKREIDTILAAKRYEFKVMSAIPYIIIAYMSLSFPEFMSCLYGNIIGSGVMTICLVVYMGACALGARLVDIEV